MNGQKTKESACVQGWLASLPSPWEHGHKKTNVIHDMHKHTVSVGTIRGCCRGWRQWNQRRSFSLHLNVHNLRLCHCAEVRVLSHRLLFIVFVRRFDLSSTYRARRRRTHWVEWRGNNADCLTGPCDGAEGKGGELEIEKTKIGQWKLCTKASSFYHRDGKERADSKCVFQIFPHTEWRERRGEKYSFAFHFNILKAFPVLSYDSALINN